MRLMSHYGLLELDENCQSRRYSNRGNGLMAGALL